MVLANLQLWNLIDCSVLAIIQHNIVFMFLSICFFFCSSLQHAKKIPVNVNGILDDAPAIPSKKKVQRGRATRSQYRPKPNISRPDQNEAAPLLAGYDLAKKPKQLCPSHQCPLCLKNKS
jgi:hypothetical protein